MRSATSLNGRRVCVGLIFPRLVTGAWLTKCRCSDSKIDNLLETQFGAGRLYAVISSRPGQVGRADGYILEGKELEVSFNLVIGVLCEVDGRNDYLVLLEEAAEREAEARVADTHCGGGGASGREKMLPGGIAFGDLVLMRSVLPCDDDENDTDPACSVDLYREGMM